AAEVAAEAELDSAVQRLAGVLRLAVVVGALEGQDVVRLRHRVAGHAVAEPRADRAPEPGLVVRRLDGEEIDGVQRRPLAEELPFRRRPEALAVGGEETRAAAQLEGRAELRAQLRVVHPRARR